VSDTDKATGTGPATVVTHRDGLVVRMQQDRSRDEALAIANPPP
jgi:hypothetical protein